MHVRSVGEMLLNCRWNGHVHQGTVYNNRHHYDLVALDLIGELI